MNLKYTYQQRQFQKMEVTAAIKIMHSNYKKADR